MNQLQFGFLGGGQMATAIARGAILSGIAKDADIAFCDTNVEQIEVLKQKFPKCHLTSAPDELFDKCTRIVLAVKPQILLDISSSLADKVTPEHLLVSIAAGISLGKLASCFGTERIIRVMPNTPCQSLEGASGIAIAKSVTPEDFEWCKSLF